MYKSAKDILRLLLRMQVREKQQGFDWNHLDVSTCIDHGKGFLRATLICVLRKVDESGEQSIREEQHCFSVGNAQCAKDNCDIVKGTFGRLLNEEMKAIGDAKALKIWLGDRNGGDDDASLDVWNNAKVTIGAHEEESELTNNNFNLFTKIPIELWMAGDLKWIAAAFGKENSSGHWCPWCLKSAKEWCRVTDEQDSSIDGQYWTSDLLREFASRVQNGELKTSSQRKGVVAEAAIDYVGPERIVFPVLHATLGFGNDWLKSFIKEMQAASEAYTEEYLRAEEAMGNATEVLDVAVRSLRQYKAQVRETVKENKKALRKSGANTLGPVQRDNIRNELERIEAEINKLQEEVAICIVNY